MILFLSQKVEHTALCASVSCSTIAPTTGSKPKQTCSSRSSETWLKLTRTLYRLFLRVLPENTTSSWCFNLPEVQATEEIWGIAKGRVANRRTSGFTKVLQDSLFRRWRSKEQARGTEWPRPIK